MAPCPCRAYRAYHRSHGLARADRSLGCPGAAARHDLGAVGHRGRPPPAEGVAAETADDCDEGAEIAGGRVAEGRRGRKREEGAEQAVQRSQAVAAVLLVALDDIAMEVEEDMGRESLVPEDEGREASASAAEADMAAAAGVETAARAEDTLVVAVRVAEDAWLLLSLQGVTAEDEI